MSVSRLLTPSSTTLRCTRPRRGPSSGPPGPDGPSGPCGWPASDDGRSRTEEYTGPSRPRRTATLAAVRRRPSHSGPVVVSDIGPSLRSALRSYRALCPKRVTTAGQTAASLLRPTGTRQGSTPSPAEERTVTETVPGPAANRRRVLGFVALCVVCVATGTGYVLHSRGRVQALKQAAAALPSASPESVAAIEAQPHVLFRNLSTAAQAGYVALAPLGDPDGPRQITGYPCRRLYMAAGHGLCLAEQADDPFGTPYRARFFRPD